MSPPDVDIFCDIERWISIRVSLSMSSLDAGVDVAEGVVAFVVESVAGGVTEGMLLLDDEATPPRIIISGFGFAPDGGSPPAAAIASW